MYMCDPVTIEYNLYDPNERIALRRPTLRGAAGLQAESERFNQGSPNNIRSRGGLIAVQHIGNLSRSYCFVQRVGKNKLVGIKAKVSG